ncbi:lamin tail domain-containing protein [Longibacter sp.]|uniref:lamin tail domain-containing protein n=1 Tax=Longibacter sp. TaxID=2045415 RepID=UPI003EBA776E
MLFSIVGLLLMPFFTGSALSADTRDDTPYPFGPLIVNEIHAAPDDTQAEFIEILNRSGTSVPLTNVAYADGNEDYDLVLPSGRPDVTSVVEPGQYLVLVRDSVAAARAFPDLWETENAAAVVIAPPGWEGLNNGGDDVFIRIGTEISDRVTYGANLQRGVSLERIDPNAPSAEFNFLPSTATASPGQRNTRFDPDTEAPLMVFAEEISPSADGSDRLEIFMSESVQTEGVDASVFQVGDRSVREVTISDDGRTIRLVLSTRLAGATQAMTVRAVGLRDRTGNRRAADTISVALQPDAGHLRITEIMYDPRTNAYDGWPDQTEYVEMLNTSDRRLTLHRIVLTGAADEHGDRDRLATVNRRIALAPGRYALVYAAGDLPGDTQATRLSSLHQAFPSSSDVDAVRFEEPASSLRLRNSGRSILLRTATGTLLDSVRYDPAWHVSDLASTDGVSLSRISAAARSNRAETWTSSAHPDGGTPGRANEVNLPASPSSAAAVSVSPSPFSIQRDGATRIQYRLRQPAGTLRVRIFDAHGRPVRTLVDTRRSASAGEILWDGRTDTGQAVRMGIYIILFESVDIDGASIQTARVPVVVARGR